MKIKKEYFQYFIEAGQKQVYQPSDIIYMQEDDADLIYLILNGKVKVYVMNSNGKEVTMNILQSGDILVNLPLSVNRNVQQPFKR